MWSRGVIEHRLARGRMHTVYRGVYALGHAALTPLGRLVAALLAAGPGAILSHRTAAALWQLIPSMPPFAEVTLTDRRPRHRPGLVIHHKPSVERTRRHGLPLTTPLATILDLPPREAHKAANEALVRKLLTHKELEAAGILGAQPTRSPLEDRLLPLIRQARLPEPQVNVWIGPYLIDFHWPDARLVVETDGFATHGHRLAFESDRARDADLQARGYRVLRFTEAQLAREPLLVIARITRVLATEAGPSALGVC